jgi:hypothetical protein
MLLLFLPDDYSAWQASGDVAQAGALPPEWIRRGVLLRLFVVLDD